MGAGVTRAATVRRQRTNHQRPDPAALRCRVTLRDGRPVSGELPAERHRALQLWMLHRETRGLVELTPGTRDVEGRLHVDRRSRSSRGSVSVSTTSRPLPFWSTICQPSLTDSTATVCCAPSGARNRATGVGALFISVSCASG